MVILLQPPTANSLTMIAQRARKDHSEIRDTAK